MEVGFCLDDELPQVRDEEIKAPSPSVGAPFTEIAYVFANDPTQAA